MFLMGYIRHMDTSGRRSTVNLATVDLNLLVSLHALLEERSVTGAAERLGLSQPAMSHALRRIRKLFDDQILVREGNRSILTPRAQGLLGPLRDVLSRTSGLLGGEIFDPRHSQRTVTVAMSTSVAYILGGPLTRLLEEQAPGVRLRVITTADMSDAVFTEGQADVLLLAEGYASSHSRERLFDDDWVVVSGTARITTGDKVIILSENQSTYIPLGQTHRLENPGRIPLELIEVQSGSYLGENDIVRFEDVYNRV